VNNVVAGESRCNWILGEDGEAHEFTPQDQELMVRSVIEPMASDGLRTICLAYKDYVIGKPLYHMQFSCLETWFSSSFFFDRPSSAAYSLSN